MDIKAMAKSKRSHAQHNQPRKPHYHSPNPTSFNANPSNSKKETKEKKKVVPPKPSLPSNWDRYDDNVEEGELGQEIPIHSASDEIKAVEGVMPKCKGADFRYLIAQAKESKQQFSPSFGDTVDDFYQGLAPMLDVKSEGIPSWIQDDDFLLENEATSQEAPNFSLDFKALAEELAKADLAKRLFIEADLLPPKLRGLDANEVDNHVPENRVNPVETFQELYSIYLADEKIAETEDACKQGIMSSSDETRNFKARDTPQPSRMTDQDTESRLDDLDSMPKVREVFRADHVSQQDTKPSSKFVGDVSEEELDMLLNSFNETKLFDSPATSMRQQGTTVPNLKGIYVTHEAPLKHSRDASRPEQIITSLNDELDGLLDASNLNKKGGHGAPLPHFLDPSRPAFPVSSCSLDDELDNLLEETSKPARVKMDPSDFPSSSSSLSLLPGSNPKVMDNFDSWLDTL